MSSMVSHRHSAINVEIAKLSRNGNISLREIAIAVATDRDETRIVAHLPRAFLPVTFVPV